MANASIRYGARIRKRVKAIKAQKQARYMCGLCGKQSVKRISTAIWRCGHCNATFAGGAYSLTTPIGETAKRIIAGLNASK